MNISLTLNFDTVEQLEKFMLERKGGTNVAASAPAALKSVPVDVAATVETVPGDIDIDPMDMGEETPPQGGSVEDFPAMRAELMTKLKGIAGKLDDPKVLGVFINAFDVVKFSDLPDDRLVSFSAALTAEFG